MRKVVVPETESNRRSEARFCSIFEITAPFTYQHRYQHRMVLNEFDPASRANRRTQHRKGGSARRLGTESNAIPPPSLPPLPAHCPEPPNNLHDQQCTSRALELVAESRHQRSVTSVHSSPSSYH